MTTLFFLPKFRVPTSVDVLPILSPPENIKKLITDDKRKAKSIIGKYDGMGAIAHVTLNSKLMGRDLELIELYTHHCEKVLSAFHSIELTINGYSYLKHGTRRTLCANFENNVLRNLWFRELTAALGNRQNSFVPHITIVKNIEGFKFEKLWPKFQITKRLERFKIDRLTLLRRETYNTESHYELYKEYKFKEELFTDSFTLGHNNPASLINELNHLQQLKLL